MQGCVKMLLLEEAVQVETRCNKLFYEKYTLLKAKMKLLRHAQVEDSSLAQG